MSPAQQDRPVTGVGRRHCLNCVRGNHLSTTRGNRLFSTRTDGEMCDPLQELGRGACAKVRPHPEGAGPEGPLCLGTPRHPPGNQDCQPRPTLAARGPRLPLLRVCLTSFLTGPRRARVSVTPATHHFVVILLLLVLERQKEKRFPFLHGKGISDVLRRLALGGVAGQPGSHRPRPRPRVGRHGGAWLPGKGTHAHARGWSAGRD